MTMSSSASSNSNSNTSNSNGGGGTTLRQRKKGSNANANATTTASSDDSDDIIPNKKPTTTSKLYQRLESSSSITSIVDDDEKNNKNGNYLKEITKIPGYTSTSTAAATNTNTTNNGNGSSHNNGSGSNNNSTNNSSIRKVLSGNEKNGSKILIRAISGLTLIVFFMICIYLGHLYVCLLVALSEILLFRELVKVRYNTYFESRIQDTIPLFRTTQWMWFVIAIFYTYSEFIMQVIDNNPNLYYLIKYTNPYLYIIIFTLYSCTFVITIVTLKVGHIKFQLNQLCWTIVVLCLTVGQMKYIMHNIFNGLFWFTFPFLCVVCNDVMAYFCGISCGRKFIKRKFMSVSPNKTWEGFIGGGICTMIFAWYFSKFLAQYSWMVCPVNDFELFPSTLTCDEDGSIHPIFQQGTIKPPLLQDYEVIPWEQIYPIQIHALWLGFFASVVGPFGGFLASAIKRAYGIKDFDSIIPGHGGITDRLDCQFLMALCTWVHYNSFVINKLTSMSVSKLIYHYNLMTQSEKKQFLEAILPTSTTTGGATTGGDE